MKNKIISLVSLLICLLTLTASTKSFVSDPQGLFDNQTKELVNQKNESYQKTKTKPEIRLLSLKDSNDLNSATKESDNYCCCSSKQKEKCSNYCR